MARQLGEAFVTVSPDGAGFRVKAYTEIKKALAGINPEVPVKLRLDRNALGQFMSAAQKSVVMKANVDAQEAYASIIELRRRLEALSEKLRDIPVGVDDQAAIAKIAALQARLYTLTKNVAGIKVGADPSAVLKTEAALIALEAATARLSRGPGVAPVVSPDSVASVVALGKATAGLKQKSAEATLAIAAETMALNAESAVAEKKTATVGALSVAENLLGIALGRTPPLIQQGNNAMRVFGITGGVLGGVFAVLGTRITLFGGLLNGLLPDWLTHITVMHLAADVLVELIAVWGGAAIAAGAFGVAASDAVQEITLRMKDLHVAADSTKLSVYPLTGALEKLHDAVRPQVYQVFGDALEVLKSHTGDFAKIVRQTGPVIDQLAGRMTAALTSGHAFDVFTKNASSSLKGLGTAFGNVFGAIGNILAVVPDYAQKLLAFGVAVTGLIEDFTRLLEPVLRWGLAIHGAFIYLGLAATLAVAFYSRALVPLAAWLARAAVAAVAYGAALLDVAASEGIAAAAGFVLSSVPIVGWVALAAAAITGLVLLFRSSSDATKDLTGNLIKLADNAPVVQSLTANMQAQAAVAAQLAAAQRTLGQLQEYVTQTGAHVNGSTKVVSQGYKDQLGVIKDLKDAQAELARQRALELAHLSPLIKQYGSATTALGILNAAGITTAQLAKDQGQAWAVDNAQIQGTIDAYRAMAGTAGQLNNDLDVLGRTETDQYKATQKLNDAWNTFISDLTSTQSTFDTLALGMVTLDQNFQQAGGSGETLKNTLGKLSVTGSLTGASMDGLTQASLDLNQAFTTQVTNADKLFASWRTAGLANNLFVQGVKDAIIPLVKYAAGSQEATAQLVALAQEADYHGTGSLKDLTKWLGAAAVKSDAFTASVKRLLVPMIAANKGAKDATKQMLDLARQAGYTGGTSMKDLTKWVNSASGATADLKKITDQATQQEALLTGAMQAQGDFIANQLIGDINQAILKYDGVQKAATAYGNAIAQEGKSSDAARAARQALIKDIVAAGTAAGDSAGQIGALIAKVLGIPAKKAIDIVLQMQGTGVIVIKGTGINQRTINTTTGQLGTNLGGHGIAPSGHAAGGLLPGFGGGDKIPAMLEAGEAIVDKFRTRKYARVLAAMGVPGFGSGGMVLPGYASGGLVSNAFQAYVKGAAGMSNAEASFGQNAAVDFARAAWQAVQAAKAATSSGSFTPGAPATGSAAAAQAFARSILPAGWSWPDLLALWNQESGWNAWAVNPTSGAYGIPQALGHGHPYNLGDYANQVRWGIAYIAGRYGSSQGAWAHEQAFNWYDRGGVLPPWGIGVNTSGKAEMVTPAAGPGSLHETNMRLDRVSRQLDALIRVTAAQGERFGRVINGSTAHAAMQGYW